MAATASAPQSAMDVFAVHASSGGSVLIALLHFLDQREVAQLFGQRTAAKLVHCAVVVLPAHSRALAPPMVRPSHMSVGRRVRVLCVYCERSAVSRAITASLRSLLPSNSVWLNMRLQER